MADITVGTPAKDLAERRTPADMERTAWNEKNRRKVPFVNTSGAIQANGWTETSFRRGKRRCPTWYRKERPEYHNSGILHVLRASTVMFKSTGGVRGGSSFLRRRKTNQTASTPVRSGRAKSLSCVWRGVPARWYCLVEVTSSSSCERFWLAVCGPLGAPVSLCFSRSSCCGLLAACVEFGERPSPNPPLPRQLKPPIRLSLRGSESEPLQCESNFMEGSWSSSGSNSRRSGLGSAPMGGGEPFEALHRGSPQYQHYQPRHSGGGLLPSSSPSASHLSGSMISQHQQAASRSSLGKLIERSTSAPPSSSSARGDGTYPYPYNGSGNSSGSAHSHHNRPHPTASYASSYAYHHGEPPLLGEATATDSSSLSLVGTVRCRSVALRCGTNVQNLRFLRLRAGCGKTLLYFASHNATSKLRHTHSSLPPGPVGATLVPHNHTRHQQRQR